MIPNFQYRLNSQLDPNFQTHNYIFIGKHLVKYNAIKREQYKWYDIHRDINSHPLCRQRCHKSMNYSFCPPTDSERLSYFLFHPKVLIAFLWTLPWYKGFMRI